MSQTAKIEKTMQEALHAKVFPGAALAIGNAQKLLFKKCFGYAEKIPLERKLLMKTRFDLASLTKPIATTSLAMLLYEQGKLSLETPISEFFSPFKKEPKSAIQIRHLLQHTSGLAAWRPYFEDFSLPVLIPKLEVKKGKKTKIPPATEKEKKEGVFSTPEELQEGLLANRKELLKKITQSTLEGVVGGMKIYSDLGFILLGVILERIADAPLDTLFENLVAKPLKLKETFFIRLSRKPKDWSRIDYAATEKSIWRRKVLSGEVHDDHAALLDGVAGHAGLFSTLEDVSRFAEEILLVDSGKSKWLKKKTLRAFVDPRPSLGWDNPAPENSQAGSLFSPETIGHLGYTGCSLWIDLKKKLSVVLLTNRVHPDRRNEAIKQFRPLLHDLVLKTFKK